MFSCVGVLEAAFGVFEDARKFGDFLLCCNERAGRGLLLASSVCWESKFGPGVGVFLALG